MRLFFLLLLTLAACKKAPSSSSPAGTPTGVNGEKTISGEPASVSRFSSKPKLDGKLDDAAWSSATVLGALVGPSNGEEQSNHPTAGWAKLGWDDNHLYVGFTVNDRAATSPFARDEKDPHIWAKASGIELMIQPGDPGDNKDYYELQVDVAGAVFDSHFDDYNAPITGQGPDKIFGHQDWSSQVERAISVEKGRYYTVELAVPWAAFEKSRVAIPPKANDVWRLNLYTFRDGQRLALAWSPLRGQGNFHRSSRFGRIRFR